MKDILLQEDDRKVFGASLSAEEFLYYTEHKDVMRTMWKEQGHAFWLNALSKFRVYSVKHGPLAPCNVMVTNGALDFPFITIAKKMTGSFGDVSEFLTDVGIVMRNMHLTGNMVKPTCTYDPFINPTTRNSFRNLFGPPDNKLRILRTFIFAETFCSWGGTLIRLLPIWKIAPRVNYAPGIWSPPASYTSQTPLRTGPFEQYLKNEWKDEIFEVCGALPQQLVWWKSTPVNGPTTLPPLQEYAALSIVLDRLLEVDRMDGGETSDPTKSKQLPKAKKGPAVQEPARTAAPEKKKKKKKRDKSNGTAKANGKEGAKPNQPEAAAAVPVRPFPTPPRVVTDATLDWHEYVTAVLGTDRLLHNQVLGGALQLGWVALTIDDCSPRVSHVSEDMRDKILDKHLMIEEHWLSAKKTLNIRGNNSTAVLRRERDELSSRIETAGVVLTAVTSVRLMPGLDPVSDLRRITSIVHQAMGTTMLRVYPLLLQYSVTETVDGDPRLTFPDFSRIRYLMKKGMLLLAASPAESEAEARLPTALAIEWYPELQKMSDQVMSHVFTQLQPHGVLTRRLAEPQSYPDDAEERLLKSLDLARSDTFAAIERVFQEIREMSGGAAGPIPPRPARLLPHTGQSLVDIYWSRLGAMLFVTDLLCMIPVGPAVNDTIQTFKFDCLNVLFDSVTELQLAQWRWLYPRTELELPRRPAFRYAAGLDLVTTYLDHTDRVLKDTHERMCVLYCSMRRFYFGKAPTKDSLLWQNVHFPDDTCREKGGGDADHCRAWRRHAFDMANRRILEGVNLLTRMGLRSAAPMDKVVESLHLLPCHLVAIQDFKANPTRVGWQAIENSFKDIVKMAQVTDSSVTLKLHQLLRAFCGRTPGAVGPEPALRQLGNREANTREFMLSACGELANKAKEMIRNERPMMPHVYEKALVMTAGALLLDAPDPKYDLRASGGPLPGYPPRQRLHLSVVWPTLLTSAEVDHSNNWRQCVPEPAAAADLLAMKGRRSADAMANEPCTSRSGKTDVSRAACPHRGADRLLCTVIRTLRNIGFTEHVLLGVSDAGMISVHCTMVNLLRECMLPYALCADRVFRKKPVADECYIQHSDTIYECSDWLEINLTSLYKRRSKIGPGRMLRFDRSWMAIDACLKPDSTVCRTISWSQACDLHMDMMRRLVKALWSVRARLPPVVQDGCEVHPVPLELLERVETGAVLLVAAFLDYRDGHETRHLIDVSELGEQVALALDLYGWLGLVESVVSDTAQKQTEDLVVVTERAFTTYERSLRHGSLLEFLALRAAHAIPLQMAVTANQRPDPQSLAVLKRRTGELTGTPVITLPPLPELRSRAARDGSLPMEWMVRLQHVRRVLLSTSRPLLLDSALVCLDYQLGCTADQLPDLPTFDGPENMSESGMFTIGCEVNAVSLCNHVFELGRHVLKYQTAMKTSFYCTQNDHIFPERRFFVKATGPAGSTKPPTSDKDQDSSQSSIMKWASEHVVKQQRTLRRGEQGRGSGPDPPTNGSRDDKDAQLTTIERLSRELESLMLSANHLKDIPEEPLEPALLERASRRAERLSEGVQLLPAGPLRDSAGKLIGSVQKAVAPPQTGKRRRKARTIAGSEMSVVDTCLSMLSSMLFQHGLPVSEEPSTPESGSETEAEPAGAAATLRVCSFCDRRERTPGAFELCSLCVTGGASEPRAYCGKACQTDDWEVGHWEDHN